MARDILVIYKLFASMVLVTVLVTACWYSGGSIETQQQLALSNPAGKGSRLPRLVSMPDRTSTLMSWVEPTENGHVLKFAVLKQGRWIRQGDAAKGERWFVNWADYPSVVPISDTFWLAHWLSRRPGGKTYDYDVSLALTNDAGKTWREIGHPHRDDAAAEHGFVTIFKESDHAAGIIWLDGRDYIKKGERTLPPGRSGNFALRYTTIHADGGMSDEQIIDDNTCTCCWTSVAQTPAGAIAVWRGRTDSEVRDNRFALMRDAKWTAPSSLGGEGWQIDACPVNGPSVASQGNQVVASWFTAQGDKPRVRIAFSGDSGKSFGKLFSVDDIAPIGRIGLVWLDNQYAAVSWLGQADDIHKKSHLYLQQVGKNGQIYAAQSIAQLSSGRDTGVPQMSTNGRELVFAWTNPAPEYGISTMLLPKQALKKELNPDRDNTKHLGKDVRLSNLSVCTRPH